MARAMVGVIPGPWGVKLNHPGGTDWDSDACGRTVRAETREHCHKPAAPKIIGKGYRNRVGRGDDKHLWAIGMQRMRRALDEAEFRKGFLRGGGDPLPMPYMPEQKHKGPDRESETEDAGRPMATLGGAHSQAPPKLTAK